MDTPDRDWLRQAAESGRFRPPEEPIDPAALLATDPLPLVVLTPKSLLRHPETRSSLRDLAEGRFRPVLADPRPLERADVWRLILFSGKIFVGLSTSLGKGEFSLPC